MNRTVLVASGLALAIGAAAGYWFSGTGGEGTPTPGEKKILYWVEPMDPNYRSDKPGKSPMGMDLVPVYEGEEPGASGGEPALSIDPAIVQNLGVRTAKTTREALDAEIRAFGVIQPDEDHIHHVHVRAEGWAEDVRVKTEGIDVKKGDLLFRIYAPTLLNAQAEYLQAVRLGQEALADAAARRLDVLGMTPGDIAAIRSSGKPLRAVEVRAPHSGTVIRLAVREGHYIGREAQVMSIADLAHVWAMSDIYEAQAAAIARGDRALMRLPSLPGRDFEGRVDYVYPTVRADTRTVQVRLAFANPDGALRPNLYADVTLWPKAASPSLAIPKEALIRTESMDRVILALGGGKFRPAQVVAGRETRDRVEILEGLRDGEEVVVSGQFLLDSDASLDASLLRLASDAEKPSATAKAMGNVVSAMPDHGMVRIEHGPVAALGWPAMTMDFTVASGVDLSGIAKGDHVSFEIVRAADGGWTITAIAPMAH